MEVTPDQAAQSQPFLLLNVPRLGCELLKFELEHAVAAAGGRIHCCGANGPIIETFVQQPFAIPEGAHRKML